MVFLSPLCRNRKGGGQTRTILLKFGIWNTLNTTVYISIKVIHH